MPALKSKQQEKACQELVVNGLSQADAYRAAYPKSRKWKDRTVWTRAYELFADSEVKVRVAELRAEVARIADEQFKIDAAYVLRRLAEIDQMDAADLFDDEGRLLPIRQWPKVWRQYISGMDVSEVWAGTGDEREVVGMLKKVKWPDKTKNLELLGKHVDVSAFKEVIEHNVGSSLADRLEAAMAKQAKRQ